MAVDAGVPLVAVPEGRELAVTVTGQETAAMLRDLTEAVATVAGRLLGLPPEDAGDDTEGPPGKRT